MLTWEMWTGILGMALRLARCEPGPRLGDEDLMRRVIALLEDDSRRAGAMLGPDQTVLGFPVVLHDNVPDMLDWLRKNLVNTILIAPDHDLGPSRARAVCARHRT